MAEFHLNIGGAYPSWAALDAFTRGYLEAAFFADCPDEPEWRDVSLADMTSDAWQSTVADCAAFRVAAGDLLQEAYASGDYDETQAGRDFWFTRQGHGVGYWDRGLGEIGDRLAALCGWGTDFPGLVLESWFI